MYKGTTYRDKDIVGVVKSRTGTVDKGFIEAVKSLMEKYEVDYVWLYWSKFEREVNHEEKI